MKEIMAMLLTLVTLTVNGQHSLLGIRGGPTWTTVTATNLFNDIAYRTGFSGGLTYEYLTDKHVSLGADLIYSQRGFADGFSYMDKSGNLIADNEIIKFNYDYVALPLKAGLNFGSKLYNFANLGVVPSWLVNAKTTGPEFNTNGNLIIGSETTDVTSRVKKVDLAGLLEIGAGYKIQNKYWLFTSFTYQHSFTTITTADYFANNKIRHNGLTLSIGLTCALTKR